MARYGTGLRVYRKPRPKLESWIVKDSPDFCFFKADQIEDNRSIALADYEFGDGKGLPETRGLIQNAFVIDEAGAIIKHLIAAPRGRMESYFVDIETGDEVYLFTFRGEVYRLDPETWALEFRRVINKY